MSRYFIVVLSVAASVLVIGFMLTPFIWGQKESEDVPTPVTRGVATEKEHIYSKVFQKKESYRTRKSLTELTAPFRQRVDGKEFTVRIGKLDDYVIKLDGDRPKTKAEKLQDTVCQSDLVVVGSIYEKSVHLIDDETFVFTLYKFRVDDILKGPSSLKKNDAVEFVRPGGLIKLDGQIIRAIDESFPPLRFGKKYLLFLRFLPESGGYLPSAPEADYLVEGDSFDKLDSDMAAPLQKVPRQFVLDAVSLSMSQPCSEFVPGGNE